jgi:ELWxxDGT repeat protein
MRASRQRHEQAERHSFRDIHSGSSGASPASLRALNATLFFVAFESGSDVELWKSDGTTGGTVLVEDIRQALTVPTQVR